MCRSRNTRGQAHTDTKTHKMIIRDARDQFAFSNWHFDDILKEGKGERKKKKKKLASEQSGEFNLYFQLLSSSSNNCCLVYVHGSIRK